MNSVRSPAVSPQSDPPLLLPTVARWARRLALVAAYVVAYVAIDAASTLIAHRSFAGTPFRPESAVAVALVALLGLRAIPAVLLAALAAEWSVRGTSGAVLLLAAGGSGAVYCASGWALRRWTQWNSPEVGLRDLTRLMLIALVTALASAAVHSTAWWVQGVQAVADTGVGTLRVIVAELTALVIIAPLLLQAAAGTFRLAVPDGPARHGALRDAVLFCGVVAAVLFGIFWVKPFDEFRMFYLLFLPMIAVAMRWGLAGALVALPIVQAGLIVALGLVLPRDATAFEFQLLMLTLAVTSLYLGSLAADRARKERQVAANEETLRAQQLALGETQRIASTAELAAALAHDLNQPLSAVGTYARAARLLAERGAGERERLLHTLDQIERESSRAGGYVRRMRDFFRTGRPHLELVTVPALIEGAYAHVRDRLARSGIGWSASLAPGLPPVRVDTVQIGAVLGNLLSNACDAVQEGSGRREIHIAARAAQQDGQPVVLISVADTGPGVPETVRDQLFKPLATTKPHGMGLGLALSRSIAERQHGRLWYDAERPMTTFCLELPASTTPSKEEIAQ